MKLLFAFFTLLIISFSSFSQTTTLDWANDMSEGNGECIERDKNNNLFVLNRYNVWQVGNGFELIKYDANGLMLDSFVVIASTAGIVGVEMKMDTLGNIYVLVSNNYGLIDVDPSSGITNLNVGANVIKYDNNLNLVWAFDIDLNGGNAFGKNYTGFAVDEDQNVYMAISFRGTADFDPSSGTANLTVSGTGADSDVAVAKYDVNGNLIWVKQTGSLDFDRAYFIEVNPITKDVIIGLKLYGLSGSEQVDLDPGLGVVNVNSNHVAFAAGYFIRYDQNGNYITHELLRPLPQETAMDHKGNLIAFNPASNGTPIYGTNYFSNYFVISKFRTDTTEFPEIWQTASQITGASGNKHQGDVTVDANNNIYAAGTRSCTTTEFRIIRVEENGTLSFVTKLPSGTDCTYPKIEGITTDGASIWVTSNHGQRTTDFDPGSGVVTRPFQYYIKSALAKYSFCTSVPNQPISIIGNNSVCVGDTITYSVASDPIATSYTWSLPTGWTGSSTIDSITVVVGSNGGSITVTADNNCGSSTVRSLSITVNALPTVFINASATITCEEDTVTLTGGGAQNYTWDNGVTDGVPFTPTTTNTYTVTGTDANGCKNTDQLAITVNPLPSVSLNPYTPDTICSNSPPVNLPTGTPSGGLYSGTGVSGSTFNPSLSGTGTFYTVYSYTDGNNCTNLDSTIIRVEICTGNNKIEDDHNSIQIFPNPTEQFVYIINPNENDQTHYRLMDNLGKVILSGSTNKTNTSLDLAPYTKGIYFIQLYNKKKTKTLKLIKK